MENLKIKCKTAEHGKQAQELFFSLGYGFEGCKNKNIQVFEYVSDFYLFAYSDGDLTHSCDYGLFMNKPHKEITIQELRDMVNPMKEYLEKQADGSYELVMRGIVGKGDDIEVPDGADCAILSSENNIYFWKSDLFIGGAHMNWVDMGRGCNAEWYLRASEGSKIIWQRHTQPEELPFLDSLNDQYAEIEQVRQQTVEATLAGRQAQYGSFVGVANTTGALMAVIKNSKNGSTLPYAHEEALHMICSKMARIVNGDYNHKDSWHDIGGYSKLIEDLL